MSELYPSASQVISYDGLQIDEDASGSVYTNDLLVIR